MYCEIGQVFGDNRRTMFVSRLQDDESVWEGHTDTVVLQP